MPITGKTPHFLAAWWAALLLAVPAVAQEAPTQSADFAGQPASADARYVADWAVESKDNQKLPFVIVDKKDARIFVFEPGGRIRGTSPVLLGLTPGDLAAPGLDKRELARLDPQARTTPAGRFVSEPGRNLQGEDVVWVDYEAALAIHRLRPSAARERRAERLASAVPEDNRISLGCVIVPVAFYENVVRPALGRGHGVVYVLPETRPAREMFGAL
ncbi:MAG TPA: hypothetical protein VLJ57_20845 [Burkholderiaceae bacterium]|nr:hypothetical protein [Burkholderiaceae bacterium]